MRPDSDAACCFGRTIERLLPFLAGNDLRAESTSELNGQPKVENGFLEDESGSELLWSLNKTFETGLATRFKPEQKMKNQVLNRKAKVSDDR